MKSFEEIKDFKESLDRMYGSIREAQSNRVDAVAIPVDMYLELEEAWLLSHNRAEGQFPVLYAGPGRHPDHPELSCVNGICGHELTCNTHGYADRIKRFTPSPKLDAPCSCSKKEKTND